MFYRFLELNEDKLNEVFILVNISKSIKNKDYEMERKR